MSVCQVWLVVGNGLICIQVVGNCLMTDLYLRRFKYPYNPKSEELLRRVILVNESAILRNFICTTHRLLFNFKEKSFILINDIKHYPTIICIKSLKMLQEFDKNLIKLAV